MESEILELKRLINQLRREDRNLRVYGASGHEYQLGPTLSEAQLSDFEQRHKITLPQNHRLYLQLVGNGRGLVTEKTNPWYYAGAGPFNGIYPLHDKLVSKNAHLPFPFRAATELTEEQYEEWEIRGDVEIPGLIEIASQGCAGTVRLVVSGDGHGEVWSEWEGALNLINPTFSGWIREWAERAIPRAIAERVTDAVKVGMTKQDAIRICGDGWKDETDSIPMRILSFKGYSTAFELDENDVIIRRVEYDI